MREFFSHFLFSLLLLLFALQIPLFFPLPSIGVITKPSSGHRSCDILDFFDCDGGNCIVGELHLLKYYMRALRILTIQSSFCQRALKNGGIKIQVETEHLKKYMNKPKTPRQVSHARTMRVQWIYCFSAALIVYMVSDKMAPGSFVDRNMFVDFNDQKAYYVKQKYLNGGYK